MMKKIFSLIVLCMAALSMQAQDTWTIAGSGVLFGSTWNINDDANNMTKNDIGNYVWEKAGIVLEAGTEYKFKIVKNHSWDEAYPSSDYVLKVNETATYTVKITFMPAPPYTIQVETTKTGEGTVGEKTWTVAGDETLMGSSWKPENAENDMQKQADGTFRLEKKGRTLAAGNYKFKVCANHGWDEAYPGSDYVLTISEDGTYDVVFTFNVSTKAVDATATKTGTAVIEKTWTLAGDETLTGFDWKPENAENDMMDMGDGTFRLLLMGKTLDCTKEYKFKVCANHAWDESYGSKNDDGTYGDYILTVDEDGVYDVTITFNTTTKDITVETEKTADAVIEKEWTVVGDQALTGLDWDLESTACNMQKQDDGTYKLVLIGRTLQKDTEYKFKVVANHGWKQQYGTTYEDGTIGDYVMVVPEDGVYSVTITFNPTTKEVVALASSPTGIAAVNRESFTTSQAFDLQGRHVAQPRHGLYIVNGKLVVIK